MSTGVNQAQRLTQRHGSHQDMARQVVCPVCQAGVHVPCISLVSGKRTPSHFPRMDLARQARERRRLEAAQQ